MLSVAGEERDGRYAADQDGWDDGREDRDCHADERREHADEDEAVWERAGERGSTEDAGAGTREGSEEAQPEGFGADQTGD